LYKGFSLPARSLRAHWQWRGEALAPGGCSRRASPPSADAEDRHNRAHEQSPPVTFKFSRVAEGDWQIEAHYPRVEIRYIRGFKSKADVDEWLAGSSRVDWLRSQGYAK